MKIISKTNKIIKVTKSKDGYDIVTEDNLHTFLRSKYNQTPLINQLLTVYTINNIFGCICGIGLDGVNIFLKTVEEIETESLENSKKFTKEKEYKYNFNKLKLDEQFEKLVYPFKDRIIYLRDVVENFQIDFEEYELFICTEAMLLVQKLKIIEEFIKFESLNIDEKLKLIPEISDSHSGNTFKGAIFLGKLSLTNPEEVKLIKNPFITMFKK